MGEKMINISEKAKDCFKDEKENLSNKWGLMVEIECYSNWDEKKHKGSFETKEIEDYFLAKHDEYKAEMKVKSKAKRLEKRWELKTKSTRRLVDELKNANM